MGPGCSSSLRIGDDSSAVAGAVVKIQDAPEAPVIPKAPPLPLGKNKGKINLIKYPRGSDYLKSTVQQAVNVGPSKVNPSYGVTFAELYQPPPGIRIWTPDALTFYAAYVLGWFVSLKSPLTMVFAFHCTPS